MPKSQIVGKEEWMLSETLSPASLPIQDVAAVMDPTEPPSLDRVGQALLRAKVFLLLCVLIGLAGGVAYLLVTPPRYTAQMTVGPNKDSPANMGASPLGGAAALLSITKDDEYVSPFQMFLEAFNSMEIADRLLKRTDLAAPLLEGGWDEQDGRWIRKKGLKASVNDFLSDYFDRPEYGAPTRADVTRALQEAMNVTQVSRSALYGIRVDYPDPAFTLALLHFMFEQADSIVREASAKRAKALVADLDQRISKISNADLRASLISFLSEQQKTLSLTSLPTPFSVTVFDPPTVSEVPTSPLILRTIAFGALIGLLGGVGLVTVRSRMRARR